MQTLAEFWPLVMGGWIDTTAALSLCWTAAVPASPRLMVSAFALFPTLMAPTLTTSSSIFRYDPTAALSCALESTMRLVAVLERFPAMLIADADPSAAAGAPQVGELVSAVWARKQSQAPFLPPENLITPPTTKEVGLAVTLFTAAEQFAADGLEISAQA